MVRPAGGVAPSLPIRGQSMLNQTRQVLPLLCAWLATPVLADVECPSADRADWMPESHFRQQMKNQGVQITKFRITPGNCYEIYGFDVNGEKVEIYYNPVDATPVAEVASAHVAKP